MVGKRSGKGKEAVSAVYSFLPGTETHSVSPELKVRKSARGAVLGPFLSDQLLRACACGAARSGSRRVA